MDAPRPCSNHCLFCFVDQMAPGCRDTLYFKDDSSFGIEYTVNLSIFQYSIR